MKFGLLLFLISLVEAPAESQSVENEGDTAILPCSKQTQLEATLVEWLFDDKGKFKDVHLYHQEDKYLSEQSEEYKGRTSLVNQTLFLGNYSLTLTNLTMSDNGTYKCTVKFKEEEEGEYICDVTLIVHPRQSEDSQKNNPSGEETKDNTGLPWWGWVLLASVVVLLVIAVLIHLYRRRRSNQRNTSNTNVEETEMPERRPLNTV